MSHEVPSAEQALAAQLRDLAVLTASIGDVVDRLEPGVIDLTRLRSAHDEHVRAFAHAVFHAVQEVRAAIRDSVR